MSLQPLASIPPSLITVYAAAKTVVETIVNIALAILKGLARVLKRVLEKTYHFLFMESDSTKVNVLEERLSKANDQVILQQGEIEILVTDCAQNQLQTVTEKTLAQHTITSRDQVIREKTDLKKLNDAQKRELEENDALITEQKSEIERLKQQLANAKALSISGNDHLRELVEQSMLLPRIKELSSNSNLQVCIDYRLDIERLAKEKGLESLEALRAWVEAFRQVNLAESKILEQIIMGG